MVFIDRGTTNPELMGTECTSFTETAIPLCSVVVTVTEGNVKVLGLNDFDEIQELSVLLEEFNMVGEIEGAGFRAANRDGGVGSVVLFLIDFSLPT